jgi:Lrp/AsnC family leucine-responsive transcriptional regulator
MPIPKLDRMDRRILEEIQADGSISNLELAERVGLSPSPCARRVKLLQDSGIISRQITLLDQKKLGLQLVFIFLLAWIIRARTGWLTLMPRSAAGPRW